jgi:hypothetical protein
MSEAKVQLSPKELSLVKDPSWILTKNAIISKAYGLFGNLSQKMQREWEKFSGLQGVEAVPPKISRGENYLGLPYVILDYPRLFAKDEVFAIRTLFWWGNFFSVTLHLKGRYKSHFAPALLSSASLLSRNGFYAGTSGDEWMHAISSDSHISLEEAGPGIMKELLEGDSFLKLVARIDISKWNEAESLLWKSYSILLESLGR